MSAWWEDFYATIDRMDPDALAPLCTEDTTVTLANHPTSVGREAVLAGLTGFWGTIKDMHHELKRVLEDGDCVVVEAEVTYTMPDDRVVRIPATTWIERRDGLVADQRIYLDLSPLQP